MVAIFALMIAAMNALPAVSAQTTYDIGFQGISSSLPAGAYVWDNSTQTRREVSTSGLELSYNMETIIGFQTLDFFTDDGTSQSIRGPQQEPEAIYFNGRTYIVYNSGGATPDPHISFYDHIAQGWSAPVKIATGPLTNDDHGTPVLAIDNNSYLHVFFGAHGTDLEHWRSNVPEDIRFWTDQGAILTGSGGIGPAYSNVITNGTDMWIFYRHNFGGDKCAYRYIASSDNGSTWGSETEFVNWGAGICIYPGMAEMDRDRGRIHVSWRNYVYASSATFTLYHAYFLESDTNFYAMDGTNLGPTITEVEADANCLIEDNEPDWVNDAALHLDANGNPFLIYGKGALASSWQYRFSRWTGSAWTSPETITTYDGANNHGDFILYNAASIEAFLVTIGSAGEGGDVERWIWNGSTWSFDQTILSEAEAGQPVGITAVPKNFDMSLRVIFDEERRAQYDVDYMRLYAWGDGFVTDVGTGSFNQLDDFSANDNRGQIIGERIQVARPDEDVQLGSWTITGAATGHAATNSTNTNHDADYVNTSTNGDVLIIGLTGLLEPLSSSGHVLRLSARAYPGVFRTLNFELRQGSTLIASTSRTITHYAYAIESFFLSTAEADAITDYTDLEVRMSASGLGGGEYIRVTWIAFETPDEPTTQVAGEYGLAWDFDGLNDYVSTGLDIPPDEFTLVVALEADTIDSADSVIAIVTKYSGATLEWEWFLNSAGNVRFKAWDVSLTLTLSVASTSTLNTGQDYFLGLRYDGFTMDFYIDGQPDGTGDRTAGPIRDLAGPIILGANSDDPDRYWDGLIDEVLIFTEVKTDLEMKYLTSPASIITIGPPPEAGPISDTVWQGLVVWGAVSMVLLWVAIIIWTSLGGIRGAFKR